MHVICIAEFQSVEDAADAKFVKLTAMSHLHTLYMECNLPFVTSGRFQAHVVSAPADKSRLRPGSKFGAIKNQGQKLKYQYFRYILMNCSKLTINMAKCDPPRSVSSRGAADWMLRADLNVYEADQRTYCKTIWYLELLPDLNGYYCAENPPSTTYVAPVMKDALLLDRNAITWATSDASPNRFIGTVEMKVCSSSSLSGAVKGVSIILNSQISQVIKYPGATQLTRMPCNAKASASDLVIPVIACFEAT